MYLTTLNEIDFNIENKLKLSSIHKDTLMRNFIALTKTLFPINNIASHYLTY